MKRLLSLCSALALFAGFPAPAASALPAAGGGLPVPEAGLAIPDRMGRAGMAAVPVQGMEGRPLIMMAGGANFPDAAPGAATPEERGAKRFYDDVLVMPAAGGAPAAHGRLPFPVAYAAFVPVERGMIIAGGCNAEGHLSSVVRVEMTDAGLVTENLPSLPVTTAYPAFASVNGKFYVVGGQETPEDAACSYRCFELDLAAPAAGWREVAHLPLRLMLAGAGAVDGRMYVVGGCSLKKNGEGKGERVYQKTVFCYDRDEDRWRQMPDMPETLVGAANPLPARGGRLYVIGGDTGEYYRAALRGKAPEVHPGQSRRTYAYNPGTDVWTVCGDSLPVGVATAPAVVLDGDFYVVSGEIRPGVRTPAVTRAALEPEIAVKEPSPFVKAGRRIIDACASVSGYTLWYAGLVALLAVLFGLRKGFRSRPMPEAAPGAGPGKWAWIAVAVLWVVVMLNYFDRQLLAVLNSSITEGGDGIPMTQAEFGTVTSAFLVVYAVLSPVGGYLADRFSRKFIILCSLVVWSTVTWLTGAARSYEELMIARACMGVSEAFYIPAALALISDYHRGNTRSMATGLHMSGIYAGQMLAGCGAMLSGDPYCLGWRLTFETFGFIGVAYAVVVVLFLHDPEAPAGSAPDAAPEVEAHPTAGGKSAGDFTVGDMLAKLFTGRAMAMLLTIYALAGFANWFIMGWYPRLLQDMFNISEAEAGPQATFWINIAKYVAVLGGAVAADMWYARNRDARAYVPGICFTLAGPCVFIAMLPALGVPIALGLGVTLALVSMQGVAQGSLDATLMPVLRSQIDERFSATGYGLLNLTSVGAGALISWLGGYLKDMNVSLGIPLSMAGALMVVCGLMFFFLPKSRRI